MNTRFQKALENVFVPQRLDNAEVINMSADRRFTALSESIKKCYTFDERRQCYIYNPKTKETIVNIMSAKGAKFETLIAPHSRIIESATIGDGCIISGSIGDCVKIGNYVNIMGSMIGQDSTIDDFSTTTGCTNIAAAHIGKRVFVGSHAVVLNDIKVGDDAYICAGSIVFSKVKAGTKVFGNPAKRMDF